MLFGIITIWYLHPWGKTAPVIVHRSSASLKGKKSHAARPQEGINPIHTAVMLIKKSHVIESIDNTSSISMTHLESGSASSNQHHSGKYRFQLRCAGKLQ
jgi:amidohydrolase